MMITLTMITVIAHDAAAARANDPERLDNPLKEATADVPTDRGL